MAKFPFWGMDYSPWSSKNLMDRNWLKKFMQIGIDVTCMQTNFGGRGLFGFRDIATFKMAKFPYQTMDYKNNRLESEKMTQFVPIILSTHADMYLYLMLILTLSAVSTLVAVSSRICATSSSTLLFVLFST